MIQEKENKPEAKDNLHVTCSCNNTSIRHIYCHSAELVAESIYTHCWFPSLVPPFSATSALAAEFVFTSFWSSLAIVEGGGT